MRRFSIRGATLRDSSGVSGPIVGVSDFNTSINKLCFAVKSDPNEIYCTLEHFNRSKCILNVNDCLAGAVGGGPTCCVWGVGNIPHKTSVDLVMVLPSMTSTRLRLELALTYDMIFLPAVIPLKLCPRAFVPRCNENTYNMRAMRYFPRVRRRGSRHDLFLRFASKVSTTRIRDSCHLSAYIWREVVARLGDIAHEIGAGAAYPEFIE
ncbi:hypothetical protein EVAR_29074_1 [Eumeta japonica]|uniref:Uncharacterized protein n=1 Tax=Eumeta variegata TaxID=151549 RepID=A0A4C1VPP1_EUMVA|nr:hypothetical protein EVAR_29074_1 [Eumeta japonica]